VESTVTPQARFPFSAVVGQSEARLALLLAAVDPGIGGVLLRGDKGSAKSTLARGLASMLPGGAPFIELPLGATEDRVLGTLDIKAALTDGETQFRPGLLASAHGGVLYVDEVNLLPDHLVDVLLDVAGSGVNRVERDGVSHEHAARFVLVGSMNPEEGELRPQLLDRFGLSVAITAPTDPRARAEIVRRRLTHDAGGPVGGADDDILLRARLAAAMPADLPDTVVDFACRLALSVGAEGLRADLVLCRAAAAYAGWEGHSVARQSDVERVAALALGHRRRRRPFDPPTLDTAELERALEAARRSFTDAHPRREPEPERETDAAPAEAAAGDAAPDERAPSNGDHDGGDHDGGDPVDQLPDDADGQGGAADDDQASPETGMAPDGTGATDDASGHADPDGSSGPPGPSEAPVADSGDGADGDGATGVGPLPAEPPADVSAGTDTPPDDDGGSGSPTAPTGSWQSLAGTSLDASSVPLQLADPPAPAETRTVPPRASHGRVVGDEPAGPGSGPGVALAATVRAAALRRQAEPDGPVVAAEDLRAPVRRRAAGRAVVLAVDASGSMGTHRRVEAATGTVLGLLADAYLRRDRVAMVTFRADGANVVLPLTASVELARQRLAELPTGGVTPLADGITAGLALARRAATDGWTPLLVLITDGRATGTTSARARATAAAEDVGAAAIEVVVIDAEDGNQRLGLAAELAETMRGRHVALDDLSADAVEQVVREALT
jgi:magnesium chelatase subunit D